MTNSFRDLRLCANPAYELVLFDRLSAAEQEKLDALGREPDNYGILRPKRDQSLGIKSASRDAALLWYSLQSPAPLPGFVAQNLGDQCDQVIARLILDGVFAIEKDGELVTGPAASGLVFAHCDHFAAENPLAALSRRALEYAAEMEIANPSALSTRLYMYNHVPFSPHWQKLLPNRAALEQYLGIGSGATSQLLKNSWTRVSESGNQGWIAWQAPLRYSSSTTYKLYVSPAPGNVKDGFCAAADVAAFSRAFHMKVGGDVHGILRPDKIVLYFREFADLQDTASNILQKVGGCPSHGVPFTADLNGEKLLSWGIDPPERESWRQRICNRLASALALGKTATFALNRVRLEGIDTETWTPTRSLNWS